MSQVRHLKPKSLDIIQNQQSEMFKSNDPMSVVQNPSLNPNEIGSKIVLSP